MSAPSYDPGRIMREVFQLARYWEGILDSGLRETGITAKQLFLVSLLEREFDGTAPVSVIANAMLTSHQNIMQMARALERHGFVAITRDTADRRTRLVSLTDEHRRFWRARAPHDSEALKAIFAEVPAARWQEFQELLDEVLPLAAARYRERSGDI
ncbi:MAG: MarR family winged helix-turn-helix transcriptional regulator [Spirochaetaceae bacterium]